MATADPTTFDTNPSTAVDAVGPALENVKRVLFKPFNLRKWLILGFIAMLAGAMGGGGSGGGPQANLGSRGGGGGPSFDPVIDWIHANPGTVWFAAGALVVGGILFALAMLYVRSVFRFIFLDSVVTGEAKISEPWVKNRAQGTSLMLWRIGFSLAALGVVALVVGLPGLAIYSAVAGPGSSGMSVGVVLGIIGATGLFILLLLLMGLIDALTGDFVVPLMYIRRAGALEAWRQFWPVLCGNKLGFVVYFLIKFASGIAAMILGFFGALVGLLIVAVVAGAVGLLGWGLVLVLGISSWSWWYLLVLIPLGVGLVLLIGYTITTILLPIPVYFQSYSLKYLGYVEPRLATI